MCGGAARANLYRSKSGHREKHMGSREGSPGSRETWSGEPRRRAAKEGRVCIGREGSGEVTRRGVRRGRERGVEGSPAVGALLTDARYVPQIFGWRAPRV